MENKTVIYLDENARIKFIGGICKVKDMKHPGTK